ncbi:MAG: DUF2892 domain-containing protein [Acaryochloris sp. RU_4_1]|nr:DUF2892 domain-containing protein [Acaryochloris sp. RU_4_1]
MTTNVGFLDRLLRLGLGVLLLYLGLGVYGGTALGVGLAITSAIPALTAIVGVCPLYGLMGIKTCQS